MTECKDDDDDGVCENSDMLSSGMKKKRTTVKESDAKTITKENWATPIARNTVAAGGIGTAWGVVYGRLWNVPIQLAVATCGIESFVFAGVFFTGNTIINSWKGENESASAATCGASGAIAGGLRSTFKNGILRSPGGAFFGGFLGIGFYTVNYKFEEWRLREKRRLLWIMRGGDDDGFRRAEREAAEKDPHPLWDRLTRLPRWLPVRFLTDEEAKQAEQRAKQKMKDRLAGAYDDFEGPMFSKQNKCDGGSGVRMHNSGARYVKRSGEEEERP